MVIQITTNAKDLQKTLRNIGRKLKNSHKKTLGDLAIQGKNIAKSLAPRSSGELQKGIFHKVFKDRAEIISRVNTPFPYNLWVNATSPFDKLTFKSTSHQPFFRIPQIVKYGIPALSPAGNPIRWTGQSGYFNKTADILSKRLGKAFDVSVNKVLTSR